MEAITSRDVLADIGSDTIVQLRHWGRDDAFVLPAATGTPITIGSSPGCTWRLADATGYLSRLHAELVHQSGRWIFRDRGSKNGLRFDGQPRREMVLERGVEVGLGALSLVVESPRTIALRSYLRCLLGWGADAAATVDLALRSIRLATAHRAALVLRGDDDLVACARELHHFLLGDGAPFIVCNPRRRGGSTVRAAANSVSALSALAFAGGGSVCAIARRLPTDFLAAAGALLAPDSRALLIICGASAATSELTSTTITIPSLSGRTGEVDLIIDDLGALAAASLGVSVALTHVDRDWIRSRSAGSLGDISKGARRMLALRASGSVAGAAELLGMSHVAFGEWLARRRHLKVDARTGAEPTKPSP